MSYVLCIMCTYIMCITRCNMWRCHICERRTSPYITSRGYQGRRGGASLSPHHVSPVIYYHRRYVVGREMWCVDNRGDEAGRLSRPTTYRPRYPHILWWGERDAPHTNHIAIETRNARYPCSSCLYGYVNLYTYVSCKRYLLNYRLCIS